MVSMFGLLRVVSTLATRSRDPDLGVWIRRVLVRAAIVVEEGEGGGEAGQGDDEVQNEILEKLRTTMASVTGPRSLPRKRSLLLAIYTSINCSLPSQSAAHRDPPLLTPQDPTLLEITTTLTLRHAASTDHSLTQRLLTSCSHLLSHFVTEEQAETKVEELVRVWVGVLETEGVRHQNVKMCLEGVGRVLRSGGSVGGVVKRDQGHVSTVPSPAVDFAITHDLPLLVKAKLVDDQSYVRCSALHALQLILTHPVGHIHLTTHTHLSTLTHTLTHLSLHDSEALVRRAALDLMICLVSDDTTAHFVEVDREGVRKVMEDVDWE
ncbi:hypothetical protein HK104_007301, partial [Borealophlyctis nickersoniae]